LTGATGQVNFGHGILSGKVRESSDRIHRINKLLISGTKNQGPQIPQINADSRKEE
jgi:hypothetical protein